MTNIEVTGVGTWVEWCTVKHVLSLDDWNAVVMPDDTLAFGPCYYGVFMERGSPQLLDPR